MKKSFFNSVKTKSEVLFKMWGGIKNYIFE